MDPLEDFKQSYRSGHWQTYLHGVDRTKTCSAYPVLPLRLQKAHGSHSHSQCWLVLSNEQPVEEAVRSLVGAPHGRNVDSAYHTAGNTMPTTRTHFFGISSAMQAPISSSTLSINNKSVTLAATWRAWSLHSLEILPGPSLWKSIPGSHQQQHSVERKEMVILILILSQI